MTDQTGATGGEAIASDLPADAPETFNSVSDAAAYFTSLQEKRKNPPAESAETATAENELSGEDNADPVTDPGETEEAEAVDPPIERPKSWSKDEDAEWQSLPRGTQQKIVARELERDTGTVRSQQEAANARKAAEAELAQAAEARKALAAKLPEVERAIQGFLSDNYPDIKTMADVERMAQEDPFRKIQWDTHQQKIAAALSDARTAHEQQRNADLAAWRSFTAEESKKLSDIVPEKEITTYTPKAGEFLDRMGFSDSDRNGFVNGEKVSPFDHRMQRILLNAMKYEEIQKAPKAVAAKPLPPVLRPGTSRPPGSASSEREQALTRKTELSVAEATELYTLQHSRRRAS